MKKLLALFAFIVLSPSLYAGLLYEYSQLATKDLDKMNKIIQEKIKESRKEKDDKTIPLKEALQAVFSRPNEDFMIEKVVGQLKNALEEHNAWEKTIRALVKEAIGALKNPKAFKGTTQVTYIVFLENIVGEFRPKMDQDFEKSVLEEIKKAEIEVTNEAKSARQMHMMRSAESPSRLAEIALSEPLPVRAIPSTTEAPLEKKSEQPAEKQSDDPAEKK